MSQLLASKAVLGAVASSGLPATAKNAGANSMAAQTLHYAPDDIVAVRMWYYNFYMNGAPLVETGTGAAATIKARIGPRGGTRHVITFSGVDGGVCADNALLASDFVPLPAPVPAGVAEVNTDFRCSAGIVVGTYPGFGNRMDFGTNITDKTNSGDPALQSGAVYGPLLIEGYTRRGTIVGLGDSRMLGLGDTNLDISLARGWAARAMAGTAFVNLGVGSMRTSAFLNATKLRQIAAYGTGFVQQFGVNDIFSGDTAATTLAAVQSLLALPEITGKPALQVTLEPIGVTGTYTSDAGQTINASNTAIQTFNAAVRAGIANVHGILDVARLVESAAVQGKYANVWGAALTADGGHMNTQGNILVGSSGILHPGRFKC